MLGRFREKPEINKDAHADILITIGNIGKEFKMIREIDMNPVKFLNGNPVAVDALVERSRYAAGKKLKIVYNS